jgi:hypothetical protein
MFPAITPHSRSSSTLLYPRGVHVRLFHHRVARRMRPRRVDKVGGIIRLSQALTLKSSAF